MIEEGQFSDAEDVSSPVSTNNAADDDGIPTPQEQIVTVDAVETGLQEPSNFMVSQLGFWQ